MGKVNTLGGRIEMLRERKDMTRSALASYLQRSRTSITRYEENETPVPSDVLEMLAILFQVSTDYLIFGDKAILRQKMRTLDDERARLTEFFYGTDEEEATIEHINTTRAELKMAEEMLEQFSQLTPEDRKELVEFAKLKIRAYKNK